MIKKLMSAVLALTLAFGAMAATSSDADAGRRGGRLAVGVAAGIIGLGILGAAANARGRHHGHHDYRGHHDAGYDDERECYPGPERCGYGARKCWYNDFGDYVCRRGEYRCYREQICD
jgi:hypothetical protein